MLWGNAASIAIWLRVVRWDPKSASFGIVAKILVEAAIFLTGYQDMVDGDENSVGVWHRRQSAGHGTGIKCQTDSRKHPKLLQDTTSRVLLKRSFTQSLTEPLL